MPDKKLTDSEIIKALSICSNENGICSECPYSDDYTNCNTRIATDTLDLINRLQAENERLKNCVKSEDEVMDIAKRTMEPLVKEITREQIDIAVKQAKDEAYKEFAERLKEAPIKCALPLSGLSAKDEIEDYFNDIMLQVRDVIDNLLKELVGENNA